ncbi:MAG: amino acid adenylation domain-containing protein [Micromonosporaceae bacterium]|nr:amino acid adenylation domain-containing protein [Micromonosporaceae bacterium]
MTTTPELSSSATVGQLSESKRELLRQRLRRTGPAQPRIPRRRPDAGAPPVSYAQQRLWFMEQFAPGTGAYTVPLSLRLRGGLDPDALARSLDAVLARHECLRTRFETTDQGAVRIVISESASAPPVRIVDLAGDATSLPERVDRARELISDEIARPFDLRQGPLLRAVLVRLDPDDHVLLVATHHIVSDGWSTDVLADELLALYESFAQGEHPALPELPVQYGDYAAWQRERLAAGRLDAAREYWRRQLAGLPPLELPIDRPRGAEQTFAGQSHRFRLERPLVDALQRLAGSAGATLHMALLAAFQVLLSRHTGATDFAVGSPVAGRPLPELERLIGFFVNMLPIRADLADDPSFLDLLTRVRDTALDAWAYQDLPFQQLVQELDVAREASQSPVFQTMLVMHDYLDGQSAARQRRAGSLVAVRFPFELRATRYDLELYASLSPDGLECVFVHNRDLFAPERIERMTGHLVTLLSSAVARPETRVSQLDMLTASELADLARWNDTAQELGEPDCLHRLVFAQVRQRPEAVAVRDARAALTYRELGQRSRRLAAELAAAGVAPGELVAVVMDRGAEQVVAALAVQLAGAAYLPVDPDFPEQRRRQLLALGRCRIALTQPWLADRLTWPDGVTTLAVADDSPGEPPPDLADPATPDDLAYVLFTSGSTGEPKGVMIHHRGAVNTVRDTNQRFGVGSADRALSVSALSFDISVQDIFGTLAAGGTLVLPEPAAAKEPAAWARWISQQRVTVWASAPALLELLVEHAEADGTDLGSLRLVLLSGDWIPLDLPDRIRALAPGVTVVSLGGATEVSIWSCYYQVGEVDPGWRSIPYGRPLANQTFHVLDQHDRPVPVGVTGQLHIGGVGVGRGYWRDPERTAAGFFLHPDTGERLYRTGDLGRYWPDGVIEILGRADFQVKVRGYRIELGEIEAQLAGCPGVAECVVTVRREEGEPVLVGYVVPSDGAAPAGPDLRVRLAQSLPAYMVPSRYLTLPRLPLNDHGKLDRSRLPAPAVAPGPARELAAPGTATERVVAEIWSEVLGGAAVGLDDNFFDLGGHSLTAIQAVTRLRRALAGDGVPAFGVSTLFRHPTVRELAALIDRPPAEPAPRRILHELTPPERAGTRTVSYVCVPYGGGQPMVYQPLADALPDDCSLYAVAIPGHDPSLPEETAEPIDQIARQCAAEIAQDVDGPLVIYGHCGIGAAIAVGTARRLEAAGRELVAVCLGGVFPFARPTGRIAGRLAALVRFDRLAGNRAHENRLRSMGAEVDGLEPDQVKFMISSVRRDQDVSEDYFTELFDEQPHQLRAPILAVVGERDPLTDYYQERYREWHFLTGTTGLVILDEAGHYFLRYRADELAQILTRTPPAIAAGTAPSLSRAARGPAASWWLQELSDRGTSAGPAGTGPTGAEPAGAEPAAPEPSLRRFLAVALSQLVSFTGTALTDFALPIWIYLTTGSLAQFAVFVMLAIVPGVLTAPLIGALVDRSSRRNMMIVGNCAGGFTMLGLGLLVWTGNLQIWHTYPLVAMLSVALMFHRLAYTAAVPQLVPKQYLGHANGVVQLANGIAQFIAPLAAVALLSVIGLSGILIFDVVTFVVAITAILLIRFPRTMAHTSREPLATEIAEGFRLLLGNPSFRAALVYFALLNILLAPLLMSLLPISLSFGTLSTAGTVAFIGGGGAALGGLVVALWGGPARRRMRGMLAVSLLLGVFGLVTGLQPSVLVVGLGAFGLWGALSVANGIYLTIIHVKLPHRLHGRVIALNQAVAWSTLPLGFAVVAPLGEGLLEPLMATDGALAPSLGAVIGTGPGRGLALLYVLLGLAILGLVLVAMRTGRLARFDDEVPDADPDDLVGARVVQQRVAAVTGGPVPDHHGQRR